MVNKILFIEGSRDKTNGVLAQGFYKLIIQDCSGKMPRIIMANDKNHAIDKFLNNRLSNFAFILIDLDKPESEKQNDLKANNLISHSLNVFYMIQEMESWFLSQPNILCKYFAIDIEKKLRGKNPKDISNPDEFLQELTKGTKKGKYHKIRHGTELLSSLDSSKLKNDFEEYRRLIDTIVK